MVSLIFLGEGEGRPPSGDTTDLLNILATGEDVFPPPKYLLTKTSLVGVLVSDSLNLFRDPSSLSGTL